MLISVGLEQISLHLSPYLSLSQTTACFQSGYLENTRISRIQGFVVCVWGEGGTPQEVYEIFSSHIVSIVGISGFHISGQTKNDIVGWGQVGLSKEVCGA